MRVVGGLRIGVRAVALVLWTGGLFLLRLLTWPTAGVWSRGDEWWRRFLLRIWAVGAAGIINMRIRVSGRPPRPPYFLVTNHLSYLDILLLSRTAGCVFVARNDTRDLPFLGFLADKMNTIYIDRSRRRDTLRVNACIDEAMDRGYGVHFFAESRISQDAQVHAFKPALLEPAARRGIPVYYAAISYRTPDDAPRAADVIVWKEPETLGQNMLRVLALPSMTGIINYGEAPVLGGDRKELAEKLHGGVLERFTPVT